MSSADAVMVDPETLRSEVKAKYAEVAEKPDGDFHFHTGRRLAARCGYDQQAVDALPDVAVEAFAGVGNPFGLRALETGEHVVDVGAGAGFDSFLAATAVGPDGRVVGVDMTPEMLERSRQTATDMSMGNVQFRDGLVEDLPVEDGWADAIIANGVLNLVADKRQAFSELWRSLRAGGVVQFADIANGNEVPEEAVRDIDLWTA